MNSIYDQKAPPDPRRRMPKVLKMNFGIKVKLTPDAIKISQFSLQYIGFCKIKSLERSFLKISNNLSIRNV